LSDHNMLSTQLAFSDSIVVLALVGNEHDLITFQLQFGFRECVVTGQAGVLLHECWQGLSDNDIANYSLPNLKSNSASYAIPDIASNPTADPATHPTTNASSHAGINNTSPPW
jgi:hypothetical protein